MGIDRIGKGGAPPVVPDAGGGDPIARTGAAPRTDAAFSVERGAKADGAAPVDAASPLGRLQAGEIDVNGYVDLKVDEATRGLEGLSPTELGDIKQVLKDQLVSDPGLVDLVRNATGHVPSPPPEET